MDMALIVKLVITSVIVLLTLIVLKLVYIKAPPNEAYLISGLRKKTVIGKSSIRIPGKKASIAKAKAERDVKIESAKASQESTQAEVEADKEKTKQLTELAKLKAAMKIEKDTIRAKADIAYKIQEEENRKLVEEKIADANLMKSQRYIEIEKNKLYASKKNETDVENYERRQKADAEQYEILPNVKETTFEEV